MGDNIAKVMARKAIIMGIKKRIKVEKFVNLKFTVHANGLTEIVVNLERKTDQTLAPNELKEIADQLGVFDKIVGEIEQTAIKFSVTKNGKTNEVSF